jgi:Peptidase family S51
MFCWYFSICAASSCAQAPVRRIYAVSYRCLYAADANHLLMRDLLKRIGKPNPRICYLPVAHGNDRARIAFWYETMQHFPCVPRHQRVFIGTSDYPDWETELFAADCIFVGGGNTLNMIAIGAPRASTKFCARRGSAVLSCQAKAPARFAGSNAARPTLARESCRRLMGLASSKGRSSASRQSRARGNHNGHGEGGASQRRLRL